MNFFRNLLRGYLTNNEINMEKKEANLLPRFCSNEDSSSSSDEETSDESVDGKMSRFHDINKVEYRSIRRSKKSGRKKRKTILATYWDRFKHFVKSPRVHFVYDAFFFSLFLLLFSYMILCEFTYYENVLIEVPIDTINSSIFSNSSNLSSALPQIQTTEKQLIKEIKKPSFIEYLLIYWMFAFMAEEARQVSFKI